MSVSDTGTKIVMGFLILGVASLIAICLIAFISGKTKRYRQRKCKHIWNRCVCEKCQVDRHNWQYKETQSSATTIGTSYVGAHDGAEATRTVEIYECINCHTTREESETHANQ